MGIITVLVHQNLKLQKKIIEDEITIESVLD